MDDDQNPVTNTDESFDDLPDVLAETEKPAVPSVVPPASDAATNMVDVVGPAPPRVHVDWKSLYGNDRADLKGLISHEQAIQISDHFTVQIYSQPAELGAHGQVGANLETRLDDKLFDATAQVVDGLTAQDVVFVEDYGCKTPALQPRVKATETDQEGQAVERLVESTRTNRQVDAWGYAALRSWAKGLKVITADIDSTEADAIDRLIGTDYLAAQAAGKLPGDIVSFVNRRRERVAATVVAGQALSALQADKTAGAPAVKPRLVVFYGGGEAHVAGLQAAFDELGIYAQQSPLKLGTDSESVKAVRHRLADRNAKFSVRTMYGLRRPDWRSRRSEER